MSAYGRTRGGTGGRIPSVTPGRGHAEDALRSRERNAESAAWCGVADVVVVGARARPSGTRKAETQRHSRAVTSTAPMSAATNSFTGRARSTRATSAHPAIVSNDASVFSSYSALPHLPHA